MRIAAITSAGACGIADYSDQLRAALDKIDPEVGVDAETAWLQPTAFFGWMNGQWGYKPDVVWINHHAALHAAWAPEHVRALQEQGIPVVATLHDTRAGTSDSRNSEQLMHLYTVCDETVVHEPVADMPEAHYIRHGVPTATGAMQYGRGIAGIEGGCLFKAYEAQPVLGTVGFDFPWKNLSRLVQASADAGWAMVILSNNATADREAEWRAMNPALLCVRKFLPQSEAIAYLTGCDATCFAYECANNGTSGAIRQGLGARKPVIAWRGCRQWRDLFDADGADAIRWCQDFDHLQRVLREIPIQRIDPGIVWLAERDSWPKQAAKYLDIFRSVAR